MPSAVADMSEMDSGMCMCLFPCVESITSVELKSLGRQVSQFLRMFSSGFRPWGWILLDEFGRVWVNPIQ